MKVTIEMAANGWLIRTQSDFPEDRPETFVYSHGDSFNDDDEVEAFAKVLWRINELIGPTTSRHSASNIGGVELIRAGLFKSRSTAFDAIMQS